MIKRDTVKLCKEVSNNLKLKKKSGRGLARVRRRTFRKGYMSLRMCDKQKFITEMMDILCMDWAQCVRICRIGLSAVHQNRGYANLVEDLFKKYKITKIWDE